MNITVQDKSQLTLKFEEPAASETYEQITWYKGSTYGGDRIVFYISGMVYYYNEYCSGSSRCSTSEKGSLNTDTGEFTMNGVELSDDDYYYYKFYAPDSSVDTGVKYEYSLEVYGESF